MGNFKFGSGGQETTRIISMGEFEKAVRVPNVSRAKVFDFDVFAYIEGKGRRSWYTLIWFETCADVLTDRVLRLQNPGEDLTFFAHFNIVAL